MKKLGLVLSGGGAKGYAHIGVIKALEEAEIVPDYIIGTSMGAIVGALYAFNPNADKLVDWAYKFKTKDFMDVDVFMLFKDSILRGNKVDKLFQSIFKDTDCRDTDIKFMAIASSLDTAKTYVLDKGPLWQVVRASMSIPMVFPPIKVDGVDMCDGGIANNLPDNVAREYSPDSVILSVDVIGDYKPEQGKFSYLTDAFNLVNIYNSRCTKLTPRQDDIRITTDTCDIGSLSYNKENANKAIEIGYNAMKKQINNLKNLLAE